MGGTNSQFKSDYAQVALRVPPDLYEYVIEEARRLGITRGDFVVAGFAAAHGRPDWDPLRIKAERERQRQETLDMSA